MSPRMRADHPGHLDRERERAEAAAEDAEQRAEADLAEAVNPSMPGELAKAIGSGGQAGTDTGGEDPALLAKAIPGGPDGAYVDGSLATPASPRPGSSLATSCTFTWRDQLEQILERPQWQTVGTPEKLTVAWAEVEATVTAALGGPSTVRAVDGQRRTAEAAEAAAVRSAAASGEPAPKAKPARDWEAEARRLDSQAVGLRDRAHAARRKYDGLVSDALASGWGKHTATLVPGAHKAAQAALVQAQQACAELAQVVAAAQAAGLREGAGVEAARVPRLEPALEALSQAASVVASLDPSIELVRPKLVPSEMERFAAVQSGDVRAQFHIQRVESSEGWKYTQFSRGLNIPASAVGGADVAALQMMSGH